MRMTRQEINDKYKVVINGYTFLADEISEYGTVNTRTYKKSPDRSLDFSIPDIMDILTAKIPRVRINFKYMTIETWRRLCQAIDSNEFTVEYFNYEYDKRLTAKMYASPQDLDNFYGHALHQLAVLNKKLDLIATMNDLTEATLSYDLNGGTSETGSSIVSIYDIGSIVKLLNGQTVEKENEAPLLSWNTKRDGTGVAYVPGSNTTLINSLELYAIWGF